MKLLLAACLAASIASGATDKPVYKDPSASVDDRVADLLSRMSIEEKTAQLVQGDISNWINTTTNAFNATGLAWNMANRAGQFYVGYPVPQQWINEGVKKAQEYLVHNTTLGIPALVQSEGIHGFLIGNATIFNSPIGQGCSWNPDLIEKMGAAIAQEALALGVNQIFAPLGDLARELRYGRVEESFSEDGYLTGELGYSYITGKSLGRFRSRLTRNNLRSSGRKCQRNSEALCCVRKSRARTQRWPNSRRREGTPNDVPSPLQATDHGRGCIFDYVFLFRLRWCPVSCELSHPDRNPQRGVGLQVLDHGRCWRH